MRYSRKILDYFHNTKHCGELTTLHRGEAADHSATVKVRIYLELDNDLITCANFKAFGSVVTIVLAEYTCGMKKEKRIRECLQLTSQQLLEALQLPMTKIHSAELIISALRQALATIR